MNYNKQTKNRIFRTQVFDIPNINMEQDELIFPFEVKTGFVNATEEGLSYDGSIANEDYARFERIFTGFETISAIWQESTRTIIKKTPDGKKTLHKDFRPGSARLMHFDSLDSRIEFKDSNESSDFIKEIDIKVARYYTNQKFSTADEFNLYLIPNRFNKEIFYVSDIKEYYDPADNDVLIYSEIELTSLNDKLSKTGLAINQYVQFSAPGEGYAYPRLTSTINDYEIRDFKEQNAYFPNVKDIPVGNLIDGATFLVENFNNYGMAVVQYVAQNTSWLVLGSVNGYVLDEDTLANKPITRIQLEVHAPGILSSVYAYGRPIAATDNSNDEIIEKPRLLLPSQMNTPDLTQKDYSKPLAQNLEYYWIPRSRMEIESFYQKWSEKVQGDWNPAITKRWLGYLRILAGDYLDSNPTSAVRVWSDITTFGVSEAVYSFGDRTTIAGGYDQLKGVQTFPKLLSHGYFQHRFAPRLPISYKESIPWSLKNIPLVGGFLSKLSLGLDIGWKSQKDTGGKNYNVTGLIPQAILDFYKNTFIGTKTEELDTPIFGTKRQDYTAIPFDALSDSSQQSALSPGDFATIINFDITDQFYADTTDPNDYGPNFPNTHAIPPTKDLVPVGQIYNTSQLGLKNNGVKWNVSSMPTDKNNGQTPGTVKGYAIDAFGFHFLGQGDYKITFFSDEGIEFTGSYKTLSKLTNSVRDWNNNIKTSHWQSEETIDEDEYDLVPVPSLPKDTDDSLNKIKNGILFPITKVTLNVLGSKKSKVEIDGTIPDSKYGDRWYDLSNAHIYQFNGATYDDVGLAKDNFVTQLDANGLPIYEYDNFGIQKVKTLKDITSTGADNIHNYVQPAPPKEYVVHGSYYDADVMRGKNPALIPGYNYAPLDSWFTSQKENLKSLYNDGFRKGTINFIFFIVYDRGGISPKIYDINRNDNAKLDVILHSDGTLSFEKFDYRYSYYSERGDTAPNGEVSAVWIKEHGFYGLDYSADTQNYVSHIIIKELLLKKD